LASVHIGGEWVKGENFDAISKSFRKEISLEFEDVLICHALFPLTSGREFPETNRALKPEP